MLDKTTTTDQNEETEDDTPLGEIPQTSEVREEENDTPLGESSSEQNSISEADAAGDNTSQAKPEQEPASDHQSGSGAFQRVRDTAKNTAAGAMIGISTLLPFSSDVRQLPPEPNPHVAVEKTGDNLERIKKVQETYQEAAKGLAEKKEDDQPPEKQRTEQPLDPPKR